MTAGGGGGSSEHFLLLICELWRSALLVSMLQPPAALKTAPQRSIFDRLIQNQDCKVLRFLTFFFCIKGKLCISFCILQYSHIKHYMKG